MTCSERYYTTRLRSGLPIINEIKIRAAVLNPNETGFNGVFKLTQFKLVGSTARSKIQM